MHDYGLIERAFGEVLDTTGAEGYDWKVVHAATESQ